MVKHNEIMTPTIVASYDHDNSFGSPFNSEFDPCNLRCNPTTELYLGQDIRE